MENQIKEDIAKQENDLLRMEANEKLVGDLYTVYAEKLPKEKKFWEDISAEESVHANWVHFLLKELRDGKVFFDKERFTHESIQAFGEYLAEEIDFAKKDEGLTFLKALSKAADIESSLLERHFFDVVATDSVELANLLNNLKVNTEVHLDNVKRMLNQHRRDGVSPRK